MERKKKSRQGAIYVLLFLAAIILLFHWYTLQNRKRMVEQNKNYAADSAHLTAAKIDEKLKSAQSLISVYVHFLEENLKEPMVTAEMLRKMEEHSKHLFNVLIYTDANGKDYAPDGRISDVTNRDFYQKGMQGESGMDIIFDPHFFDETMACFYAPVRFQGEIVGVFRGAFLAEENLLHQFCEKQWYLRRTGARQCGRFLACVLHRYDRPRPD